MPVYKLLTEEWSYEQGKNLDVVVREGIVGKSYPQKLEKLSTVCA